ncbi:MAG: SCO family protein [Deltaproteobacteria bacterium]|nr:SCO family protein [Deltaproteobacteria bacterium]
MSRAIEVPFVIAAMVAASLLVTSSPAAADGEESPSCHGIATESASIEAPVEAPAESSSGLEIPDTPLLDQNARSVKLYEDLIQGKIVAMNFIFTTCTTICPPMGANFGRLQAELGDSLGAEVELISVTIDPVTDTPRRLKAWSSKFAAGDGWTLLTGEKSSVDQLLRELEVLTPDQKDHAPLILLGNDRTGTWRRVYGLTPPAKLARMIEDLMEPDQMGSYQPAPNQPSVLHVQGGGS